MKEPVDHILRPQLPWRSSDEAITECGFDASKVKTLTRAEYFLRRQKLGMQRSAMVTCMTCSSTAERHGTWDDDPRKALQREIEWECGWRRGEDKGTRLHDELIAIAELIEAHRDEFTQSIETTEQRRAWLEKKDALEKKSARRPSGSLL